jgi:hypothetical protein
MNHDRSGGITHDLGFRFSNTAALLWRPLAGTGWVTALAVNADDQIVLGAVTLGVVVDPTDGTVGIGDVAGGAVVIEVEADGDVQIGDQTGDLVIDIDDAGNLGFFGETPTVGQQTLTATGDANRLTAVLAALENLGLIVDATTPGASTGTPFTVVTVTEAAPVELAIPVSLPAAPGEGDMFRVGYAVEYFATQPAGDLGAGHVYVWAVFEYSSAEWRLTDVGSYRSIEFDGSSHSNRPSDLSITASASTPEARTSLPVLFTTDDDTYGLFTIKGTYREIASFDIEAPS